MANKDDTQVIDELPCFEAFISKHIKGKDKKKPDLAVEKISTNVILDEYIKYVQQTMPYKFKEDQKEEISRIFARRLAKRKGAAEFKVTRGGAYEICREVLKHGRASAK